MTVRQLLLMGNPLLLQPSQAVEDPTSQETRQLVTDIRDTLESINGIGMAAPQIGVHKRVIVFCLPASRIPEGAVTQPIPWTGMVNPTIEPLGDERIMLWERCLSLPGLYAKVPRFAHTRLSYSTTDGERITRECRGYLSALLQHECDHLEGTLYPHRLADANALAYASEVCEGGNVYQYTPEEFDGLR
ncbi:MAG: peptide deformylase [Pseudomonadota bacterium]